MEINSFYWIFFQDEETDDENVESEETEVIGWCSAIIWLVLMTGVVAVLSEYVVDTIEVSLK